MLEIEIKELQGKKYLELNGRIDSLTAVDIDNKIRTLADEGVRFLVVDMQNVNYISSAGLRSFIIAQKLLTKAGGELFIFNCNESVKNIFISAGFDKIMKIIDNLNDIKIAAEIINKKIEIQKKNVGDIEVLFIEQSKEIGKLEYIGSPKKVFNSAFTANDINSIYPSNARFGLGLAGLGNNFEEYKELIGESIIINKNIFVYPASKRPIVDYIYYNKLNTSLKYNFLYGLIANGEFNSIGSFKSTNDSIKLKDLINCVSNLSVSDTFALIFITESKGIQGLSLKTPPIIENAPKNQNILSEINFANWIDFPIEPFDYNCAIISLGIVKKTMDKNNGYESFFPENLNYHFHALVFEHILLNTNVTEMEEELNRLIKDFHPKTVIHLLGESKFKNGLFGIINLGGQ